MLMEYITKNHDATSNDENPIGFFLETVKNINHNSRFCALIIIFLYVFYSSKLSFFCNRQTTDNCELREMYLKFNLLLYFTRQTISKCSFNMEKYK